MALEAKCRLNDGLRVQATRSARENPLSQPERAQLLAGWLDEHCCITRERAGYHHQAALEAKYGWVRTGPPRGDEAVFVHPACWYCTRSGGTA